jgi:uncharacterized membrane protein
MVCPKCQAESGDAFCPNCGSDLQIYRQVESLQQEVSELRALLSDLRSTSAKNSTGPAVSDIEPTPPPIPLPPPLPARPIQAWRESVNSPAGNKDTPPPCSVEVTLGQRWFLGIGVFVLLLAIGFFLKYAFDEQWIRPPVQITFGLLVGIFLIGGGEICRRRKWVGLDISFAALGLGALYLSVYAANQIYRLLPDGLTIFVVLLVSTVGLLISFLWDSRVLAVLSFLGGYLSPLLFHSDELGNWVFFGYLSALNIATTLLAYVKRWSSLSWIGVILSWIAFQVWSSTHPTADQWGYAFCFTQLSLFLYSIFPFLQIRSSIGGWRLTGIFIALINGWLCVWKSAELLQYDKNPLAIVTLAYSIVALSLALVFWRRLEGAPLAAAGSYGPAVTWLIAQGLIYLLVTWAVILSNKWSILFWAAQVVVTYWIAAKAKDRVLLNGTIILGVIVTFRFLFFEVDILGFSLANERFADDLFSRWFIGMFVIACLLAVWWLASRGLVNGVHSGVARWFEIIGLMSLFGFLNAELERLSWEWRFPVTLAAFSILWTLFAASLLVIGFLWKRKFYRICAIVLLFVTIGKVLLFDTAEVSAPYRILSCAVLGGILVALSALYYRFATRLLSVQPDPSAVRK